MRICFISKPNKIIINLAHNLSKNNQKTSLVASFNPKIFKNKDLKLLNKSFNSKIITENTCFWLIEKNIDLQLKIINFFKNNKFDLVITDALFPSGLLSWIPSSLNIPVIAIIYGMDVLHVPSIKYGFKEDPRKRRLIPFALEFIDGFIGTSESIKHLYKNWEPKSKLYWKTTIPVSIEKHKSPDKSSSLCKKWGIKKNQPVILSMFRIFPEKGQKYLIKSLNIIKKKIPNILLIIAGDTNKGKYLNEIKTLIKKHGLKKNVKFVGYVEKTERQEIFSLSDLFIISSLAEIGPRVLFLALHYKLPVITTKVGHTIDLLKNNESCIFIPKRDPESIAKNVITLLNSKKLRNKLSNNGYKIAEKSTWPAQADNWLNNIKILKDKIISEKNN